MPNAQTVQNSFDAIIIGAGFSGMYQLHSLRDRLGLSAAECVFVDDTEGNILAARALGFAAVYHQSPAATRTELLALLAA